MNKPYIYKKTLKATGKSYIGKHNGNDVEYLGSGTAWKRDLKKHMKNREQDLIEEILEIVPNIEDLNQREEHWLKYYDAKNNPAFYNATNRAHGGNRLGIPHTDKAKEKNRIANLGRVPWNKGLPKAQETIAKFHKAVKQYNSNGEFIQEYASIKEAAKKTGINSPDISTASNGKKPHAKGFIWIKSCDFTKELLYSKVERLKKPIRSGNPKEVLQIDSITGEILNEFSSCTEVKKVLGIYNVDTVARGKAKTAGGFIWKYKNEN